MLGQGQDRRVLRVSRQLLTLLGQPALALGQAFQALLQLLNPRLLHLGLPTWLGGVLGKTVPLLLPAVHGALRLFQRGGQPYL